MTVVPVKNYEHNNYTKTLSLTLHSAHLSHEDKHQDESGASKKSDTKHKGMSIDELSQGVVGDYHNSQNEAGDIGGHCDGLGIIQTPHLHIPCGK